MDITIPGGASISGLTVEKAEAKAANAQPALYAIGDSTVILTKITHTLGVNA